MDRHKEERDDLLPPSGSNDGPSFPVSVTWSEAGYSSSSATLVQSPSTARRIRLRGTPGVIAGLLFGAALTAVLHHVYLFILRGRTVSGQFWIKNSSNALNLKPSIHRLSRSGIYYVADQFTILQLNHLFGLPDPLRILRLASSRRLWNAIPIIIIATIFQAFALVSILAPNSLEVGSASPQITTISVPTALFNKPIKGIDCALTASADSKKVLGLALQSEKLIGWNAPAGCGTVCNYTIQYSAPALRCTELAIDEANTMLPIQSIYTRIVYNATNSPGGDIEPMSIAWRTFDTNGKSTIGGTRCALWNTTQQSVVSFVNNTGIISPSIISYNSPVNTDLLAIIKMCSESGDSSNATSVSLYSYAVVGNWLFEQLNGSLICETEDILNGDGTFSYCYPSADPPLNMATNNLFSQNETAGTLTPNSENVSSALEQILDQLVWVYDIQRLWIIYATALAVAAACGAVGLACVLKNGEDRDLTFWEIVRATRNSELDAVVEGEKHGDAGKDTMLQYAVQGQDSDASTSGVFIFAMPRRKGSN
ncbi:hypothetical protein EV421DRAFT_1927770 [Armillaria borealis]|uniref:Uncharacterized protein n=1 Tax=Armillaria borealis TaxID=47425 RepID=A0AA39IX85_9AGAR|nr:hypothetical protein EV421DRAFT_1927770 [Armillaria borealis]